METKTMVKVPVEIFRKFPECQATCPYSSECANHVTAGDFRTEGGDTPDLTKIEEDWWCSKAPKANGAGAVLTDGTLVGDRNHF